MSSFLKNLSFRHAFGSILFLAGITYALMNEDRQIKMQAGIVWLSALNLLLLPDAFRTITSGQYIGTMKIAKAIFVGAGFERGVRSSDFDKYPKTLRIMVAVFAILGMVIYDLLLYALLAGIIR